MSLQQSSLLNTGNNFLNKQCAMVDIYPTSSNSFYDCYFSKKLSTVSTVIKSVFPQSNLNISILRNENIKKAYIANNNILYNFNENVIVNVLKVDCHWMGLHTIVLQYDGNVMGCGKNSSGQLGTGNTFDYSVFTNVLNLDGLTNFSNIIDVCCGRASTYFIDKNLNPLMCGFPWSYYNRYILFPEYINYANTSVPLSNITQISCGYDSHMFLNLSQQVLSYGYNDYGQLGIGRTGAIETSPVLSIKSNVTQVSCGFKYALFLENTGYVSGCGYSADGALGYSTAGSAIAVTAVSNYAVYANNVNISNIVKVCTANTTSFFLQNNGYVLSSGYSPYYTLSQGYNVTQSLCANYCINYKNQYLSNIIDISVSYVHVIFLENTGQVLSCGANDFGQLGIYSYRTSRYAGSDYVNAGNVGNNANVWAAVYMLNYNTFISFPTKQVKRIATCSPFSSHCLFQTLNNNSIGTGFNANGQLGNSNFTNKTTTYSTKIIDTDLNIYSYERFFISTTPIYTSNIIGNTGYLSNISNMSCGNTLSVILLNTLQAVSCGLTTSLGINITSPAWIVDPQYVVDNNNNILQNIIQVSCGRDFSLYLLKNYTVYGSGQNTNGQLGINSTNPSINAIPVLNNTGTAGLSNINYIDTSGYYSIFLERTNKILGCGYNSFCAPNYASSILLPTYVVNTNNQNQLLNISNISAGYNHAIYLENTLKVLTAGGGPTYGGENYGQLSRSVDYASTWYVPNYATTDGTNLITNIISVEAGYNTSFAINNTYNVYASGRNYVGQLGIGNKVDQPYFTFVRDPTNTANLGNIIQVVSQYSTTFFLENTNKVLGCGRNEYGQLGIYTNLDFSLPVYALFDQTFNELTFVKNRLTNITNITTSIRTSICWNKNTGIIYGYGDNSVGQLALDANTEYNFTLQTVKYNNSSYYLTNSNIYYFPTINSNINMAISKYNNAYIYNGNVICDGYNYKNMFGILDNKYTVLNSTGLPLNNVIKVAVGELHSIFLVQNGVDSLNLPIGVIYSCGDNSYGQLGTGNNTKYYYATLPSDSNNKNVKDIACGLFHTIIVQIDDFNITSWCRSTGKNNYGQLGVGDNDGITNYNTLTLCVQQYTQIVVQVVYNIAKVICGENHSVFLTSTGAVYTCGLNNYGQLGNNTLNNLATLEQVVSTSGQVVSAWGFGTTINYTSIANIACGKNHTILLSNNKIVYTFGNNNNNQLGISNNTLYSSIPISTYNLQNYDTSNITIYSNAFMDKTYINMF